MKIVIDIDEETYQDIKNGFYDENTRKMAIAIGNGKPLPKNHGRLIDADALGEKLHRYSEAPYQYALKVFNESPTIIENETKGVMKNA